MQRFAEYFHKEMKNELFSLSSWKIGLISYVACDVAVYCKDAEENEILFKSNKGSGLPFSKLNLHYVIPIP